MARRNIFDWISQSITASDVPGIGGSTPVLLVQPRSRTPTFSEHAWSRLCNIFATRDKMKIMKCLVKHKLKWSNFVKVAFKTTPLHENLYYHRENNMPNLQQSHPSVTSTFWYYAMFIMTVRAMQIMGKTSMFLFCYIVGNNMVIFVVFSYLRCILKEQSAPVV